MDRWQGICWLVLARLHRNFETFLTYKYIILSMTILAKALSGCHVHVYSEVVQLT